jgi:hypothetical protein
MEFSSSKRKQLISMNKLRCTLKVILTLFFNKIVYDENILIFVGWNPTISHNRSICISEGAHNLGRLTLKVFEPSFIKEIKNFHFNAVFKADTEF